MPVCLVALLVLVLNNDWLLQAKLVMVGMFLHELDEVLLHLDE